MVFGKIFLDEIHKEAKRQQKEQARKEKASAYWLRCPACGRKVAIRQILAQGCWVCGWRGTEKELELARSKRANGQETKRAAETSYRTRCPGCGRPVIREELMEKGCYVCGWKGSAV